MIESSKAGIKRLLQQEETKNVCGCAHTENKFRSKKDIYNYLQL